MSLTTDRNDPRLGHGTSEPGPQNEVYLVLSADERAKGFVRPVRRTYRHVGVRPEHPTRDLTPEEHERYDRFGYTAYEPYPEGSATLGRFWTVASLASGCGAETTMAQELAETYAREPGFYGATYCVGCQRHVAVEQCEWLPGWGEGSIAPEHRRVGT